MFATVSGLTLSSVLKSFLEIVQGDLRLSIFGNVSEYSDIRLQRAIFAVMTQRRILVFGLCLCLLCAFVFYYIWMTYYLTANHTHVPFGLKNSDCEAKSDVTPRRVNTLVADYDSYLNASLYDVIGTKASPRDPRVVNLVEKLLDPPSKQMIKLARHVMKTP